MKIILTPKKSKNVHSRGNCCNGCVRGTGGGGYGN